MSDPSTPPNPLAPYPTLAERDTGALPEPEMYDGVPLHMHTPLLRWAQNSLLYRTDLAQSVLARCRVALAVRQSAVSVLCELIVGNSDQRAVAMRAMEPLDYLNALINLHPDWDSQEEVVRLDWLKELADLELILRDCGSAWCVNIEFRGLYRRVDATVMKAWRAARTAAEEAARPSASRYLAQAWQKVFGRSPLPTDGYADAVKAVEAVTCPVVLPKETERGTAMVHRVRTELTKNSHRWRFVLVEGEDVEAGHGSIDVVATMLNRLLRGETERHGLEGRNRPSTQAEAEAAVHLAAVLVQWFSRGAIQPRDD